MYTEGVIYLSGFCQGDSDNVFANEKKMTFPPTPQLQLYYIDNNRFDKINEFNTEKKYIPFSEV